MKSQSNTGNRKKIFVVNCCGILETWMKMWTSIGLGIVLQKVTKLSQKTVLIITT
jgi:hypothetical protein